MCDLEIKQWGAGETIKQRDRFRNQQDVNIATPDTVLQGSANNYYPGKNTVYDRERNKFYYFISIQ